MKKLIPFTLERWQQGNCTPKTADGREVKYLTNFETKDTFPLVGAVDGKKETWTLNGWYNVVDNESKKNLMLEVDCEVVYVSVLRHNNGGLYSEVTTLEHCFITHPNFIKEIKVEL